ncbi:MAG: hypothetical protein GY719_36200 [bacterium]|nr:hypothetical protein [bacterium]
MKTMLKLSILLLALTLAAGAAAETPDGDPPSEETVCDPFIGDENAFGLCNAYCEAMDCDSPDVKASQRACERKFQKFKDLTGSPPPCAGVNCPCLSDPVFEDLIDGTIAIAACSAEGDEMTDPYIVSVSDLLATNQASATRAEDDGECEVAGTPATPTTAEEGIECANLLLEAAEAELGEGACDP